MINKKYTETKKNKGNIPKVKDERVRYVAISCGKCMECMRKKARDWQIRLTEEVRENRQGYFVTLTMDEKHLKLYKKLAWEEMQEMTDKQRKNVILENLAMKIAVRRFLERWRKDNKKSVKHWFITELGHNGTERIHIHGIIWTEKSGDYITGKWSNGMTFIGNELTERTVNYIIKYVHKMDIEHKGYVPKVMCTPGLGKSIGGNENYYKYRGENTRDFYEYDAGNRVSMPTYYRNKLYTEEERELLWIKKLDEETMYVGGEKVKMNGRNKKQVRSYLKVLEYNRKLNKELGYGDESEEWSVNKFREDRKKLTREKDKRKTTMEKKISDYDLALD